MKVVVTGGAGFIGSNVVSALISKGHDVVVIDNLSKPESKMLDGCEFLKIDLAKDCEATRKAFKGADACFNLAAKIGGIGYFHKYPATILSENNKIYGNTFEAAAAGGVKQMLYFSSSMVFESASKFPSEESDVPSTPPPHSCYGMSKLVGEWYCRAFFEEYGLNYTIIRPFNAYGVNEWPGNEIGYAHVIPDLTRKILSGQTPLELLGDGAQTRCFTHVRDLARGAVMALGSPNARNEDFNMGTSEETKIVDLARLIWALCDRKDSFRYKLVPGFRDDVRRRVPETRKAFEKLGFKPQITLEEGLSEVVGWLRKEMR